MAWSSLPLSFSSLSFCLPSSSSFPLFSRSIRSLRSRLSLSCGSSVTDSLIYYPHTTTCWLFYNWTDQMLIRTHHFSADVLERPPLLPLIFQQPPPLLCLLHPPFQSLGFSLCFGQELGLKRKNKILSKEKQWSNKKEIVFLVELLTFASASSSAFFLARSSSNDRGWACTEATHVKNSK